MKIFKKEKQQNSQEPFFTTAWKGARKHEIEVFGNVDKTTGITYYQCVIDDEKTFTISKFNGQKWAMASGEENVLSETLGEIVEHYNRLHTISKFIENRKFVMRDEDRDKKS